MKKELTLTLATLSFTALALLVSGSQAAVIRVGSGGWGDYATIQEAVDAGEPEDEIWVKAETYALDSSIDVNKLVYIYGGFDGTEISRDQRDWDENETIIDGQQSVRCLYITAAATFDGFTIQNGEDSTAFSDGGGAYVDSASAVIANCHFLENGAGWRGGAIFSNQASPTITTCTFSLNDGGLVGGAIYNYNGSPNITGCTFSQNEVLYKGGAIYNEYFGSPVISDCSFTDNETTNTDLGLGDSSGGAIYNDTRCSPQITHCAFSGNTAGIYGGAIYNNNWASPGLTRIANCSFSGNTSQFGGGIFNVHASSTVTNCIFSQNSASSKGGGIYNANITSLDSLSIRNCTLSGNNAGSGLGVYNSDSGITIMNCIVWSSGPPGGQEIVNSYSSCDISFSDIRGSGGSDSWDTGFGSDGGGNIDEDPVFQDTISFYLAAGSPCIDAGNPDTAYNDPEDPLNPGFAVFPAMGGLRNDMGAYGGPGTVDGIVAGIPDEESPGREIPHQVRLAQNYPNPFGTATTIEYSLPHSIRIEISLFNILGQKVRTLFKGVQASGSHRIAFHGEDLPSGVYFYELRSNESAVRRKCIRIR